MLLGHLDSAGRHAHQRIPFPLDIIGARYEHVLMKLLGRMTASDFLYRHRSTRAMVSALANRVILPFIHGEVVTPAEVEVMVKRLEREGHLMAVGVCECRHGELNYEEAQVDGEDPNLTCVMIGDWGRGHLYNFPDSYRPVCAEELAGKAAFWHERGRVLNAWGFRSKHGFLVSYCHCMPEYCVPLRSQLSRGTRVFLPGYSVAGIDAERCLGPGACDWNCMERCFFGAISEVAGKASIESESCFGCGQCFVHCPSGAAGASRREGHELVYCASDLLSIIELPGSSAVPAGATSRAQTGG